MSGKVGDKNKSDEADIETLDNDKNDDENSRDISNVEIQNSENSIKSENLKKKKEEKSIEMKTKDKTKDESIDLEKSERVEEANTNPVDVQKFFDQLSRISIIIAKDQNFARKYPFTDDYKKSGIINIEKILELPCRFEGVYAGNDDRLFIKFLGNKISDFNSFPTFYSAILELISKIFRNSEKS